MFKTIADAVTTFFVVVAAILFWKLANKFGAKIPAKRFVLILIGLLLVLRALFP